MIPENIAANRPSTPFSSRNIKYFQTPIKAVRVPRYAGDIQMSHITPKRAKRALDIVKSTTQNQQKKR